MRVLLALLLTLLIAATTAPAQVMSPPPAGIILPNYDLVRLGKWEALESGAVVARTDGPLANVYNPAGLAATKKTEINASASGFQYTSLSLEGIGSPSTSTRFASLGGFLGVALAKPVVKSANWRLGFSVFSALNWKPGTLSGQEQSTATGADLLLDYRTQVNLHAMVPALAAGVSLSRSFRVGFGFQVPVVTVAQQQATSFLSKSATTAIATDRTFAADGTVWLVRGTAGVQWDLARAVSLGVMVETPTARLWGSSFYSDLRTASSAQGFAQERFRDPHARLDYKLPTLLAGGIAFRFGKVQLEGDVRYYSSVSQFDLYSSDSVGVTVSDSGANPPVSTPVRLAPVALTYRSVVNFAAGARFPLSQRWQVHAGVNSDQSPLPDTREIFRNVNLTGATAGLSYASSHLSGSLGVGFQNGQSPTTTIDIASEVRQTRLTVKTFQLLYAIAYSF